MAKRFKVKQKDDSLKEVVDELLSVKNETAFYYLISQRLRGKTGKTYMNRDNDLPKGRYGEFEVNKSDHKERIVIEMDTYEIYSTDNHYETMHYEGKAGFLNS